MKRTLTITILLLATPLQASEPPAMLPKEFLAQLPLLMSLSDPEFEGLLASTQPQSSHAEAAAQDSTEENNNED